MTRRRYFWAGSALAATLVIAGCSSDSGDVNDATTSTASDDVAATSAPADAATATSDAAADTAAVTAEPTADVEALTASDDTFTINMPVDWSDAGEAAGEAAVLATRSDEPLSDFFNNVVVVKDEPLDDLEQSIADTGEELAGSEGTSEVLDAIEVDGKEALGLRVERTQSDVELVQVQRWVEHDGSLFVIVLSSTPEGADAAESDFADILDSWNWE
ncbi:hypothetical protein K0651_12255 [Ornithinimicrobium sp. Arc0846-15]|nr:hypothetical protein [Ornithinimicrobium laminariae]